MVEDMDYNLQKIYEPFKKKYLNKVDLVDAFVNSLKKGIKMKGTPYITGFTSIKQLLDAALKPENVSLALDILTEMVRTNKMSLVRQFRCGIGIFFKAA